MATPPTPDNVLQEVLDAINLHGSKRAAADALGLPYNTLHNRWTKARERGLHLSDGAQTAMQRAELNGVEAKGGWIHNYETDFEGKKYKVGTTRWSAPEGDVAQSFLDKIREAFEGIEPAAPIAKPKHCDSDLLTVYPIADAHIGMMAWGKETGEAYNTDIAVARLKDWIGRCVASSPASERAVILDVGDLTHADDQNNQTPRSKHVLDVDTRHFRTIDATISALSHVTELALAKHKHVTVIILPGNHNPHAYIAILFAMAERYRNEKRVTVRKEPGEFWVEQFGSNMLAAHHGDKAPPERLAMYLADEHAPIWGVTKWRFMWTGHRHHMASKDIGGVAWEQLRALTAKDAYAVANAYSARAQLQAITLHKTGGEIQRVKVNG